MSRGAGYLVLLDGELGLSVDLAAVVVACACRISLVIEPFSITEVLEVREEIGECGLRIPVEVESRPTRVEAQGLFTEERRAAKRGDPRAVFLAGILGARLALPAAPPRVHAHTERGFLDVDVVEVTLGVCHHRAPVLDDASVVLFFPEVTEAPLMARLEVSLRLEVRVGERRRTTVCVVLLVVSVAGRDTRREVRVHGVHDPLEIGRACHVSPSSSVFTSSFFSAHSTRGTSASGTKITASWVV